MEVTEEWRRKLHMEKLYNLCSSPNMTKYCLITSSRIRWAASVTYGGKRNVCSIWRGYLKEIRHLQETGTGGIIKCILKKHWEGVGLINVAQDTDKWRDVGTVMNFRVS